MRAEATNARRHLRKTMEDKEIKVVSLHKNESFLSFLFLCQRREEQRNYFNPAIQQKVVAIIRELTSNALFKYFLDGSAEIYFVYVIYIEIALYAVLDSASNQNRYQA